MPRLPRRARWIVVAALAAASLATLAAQDLSAGDWLKAGDENLARRRYVDAADAYRRARQTDDAELRVRAGVGATRSLLRAGRFGEAARLAAEIARRDPDSADVMAAEGDALWVGGHFLEAEQRYAAALERDPALPAALHGRGRSLAAQGQLAEALADILSAAAADPTDPLYWISLGSVYEQQWRYRDAAEAYRRSLALLPSRAWDDAARRTRDRVSFLAAFGDRGPRIIAGGDAVHEVPLRLNHGRPVVSARVNGWRVADFELDTGADAIVLTPSLARNVGVRPTGTLQSAGVGTTIGGVRPVQVARVDQFEIGGLRLERVPAVVKSPVLMGGPQPETEGFSPLAIGLSVRIDYGRNTILIGRSLPEADFDTRLPLRQQRLTLVRATVNGSTSGSFVLDTGGDATALSQRLAAELRIDSALRLLPVRAWGSSGWDQSAFLLPYTDLELSPGFGFHNRALAVLDLAAVSAVIGVDLGGIIGHDLLSSYRVSVDLDRHELGLSRR
jgi:tetratricopeptide (TPR) repeat protein